MGFMSSSSVRVISSMLLKNGLADYFLHTSDITFDFTRGNEVIVHDKHAEQWKVTVVDTGLNTMTGGRVKRIQKYVGNEPFYLTYGDAVADVNINELRKFHESHGKCMTLTAVSLAQQKEFLILTVKTQSLRSEKKMRRMAL